MDAQLIQHIQKLAAQDGGTKEFPALRTGMQVEVSQRITE